MQDTIPISKDDRRFTFWEWIGFLCLFTFITLHFAGMTTGILAAIWEEVLLGDYTEYDPLWAFGTSVIAITALLAFYGVFYLGLGEEPFIHTSVLIDIPADQLLLKTRHITGLTFHRSLALTDTRDVAVKWTKDEDGKEIAETQLLTKGELVSAKVTNPADADDPTAFAARFRAHLAAIGWSADRE